jgi:hypothetical protein
MQLNLEFDKTETDPIKKYRLGYSNGHYPNLEYISESEFLWRFGGGSGMKVYRQIKLPNMFDHRVTYAQVYAWVQADGSGVGFEVHSYPYGIDWEKRSYAPVSRAVTRHAGSSSTHATTSILRQPNETAFGPVPAISAGTIQRWIQVTSSKPKKCPKCGCVMVTTNSGRWICGGYCGNR